MRQAPLMTVVETAPYLASAHGLLKEAERMAVVEMIAADPKIGDLIRDSGGLRKVRIPLWGAGASAAALGSLHFFTT